MYEPYVVGRLNLALLKLALYALVLLLAMSPVSMVAK